VTSEHASRKLPLRYGNLGLSRAQLSSHIGWDPGAAVFARRLAKRLLCPLHLGTYSRLLIDLNRSERHPGLIPRRAFGVGIPGNWNLSGSERRSRLERYWLPYRRQAIEEMRRILGMSRRLIHFSVHSFTPRLFGVERTADVGLLYDPSRELEKETVAIVADYLREANFRVRRNYPYRGTSDGLTRHCRTIFPADAYAGIEIEINQRLVGTTAETRRLAERVAGVAGDPVRRRALSSSTAAALAIRS